MKIEMTRSLTCAKLAQLRRLPRAGTQAATRSFIAQVKEKLEKMPIMADNWQKVKVIPFENQKTNIFFDFFKIDIEK